MGVDRKCGNFFDFFDILTRKGDDLVIFDFKDKIDLPIEFYL